MADLISMENNIFNGEPSTINYLCWSNYAGEVAETVINLQENCSMVDVTLVAENQSIKVHKMVLCLSSSYLKEVLLNNDDPNPCIILPGVSMSELKTVIEFIYKGEIAFLVSQLSDILKIAQMLGIQALNEIRTELPERDETENEITTEIILPSSEIEEHLSLDKLWETELTEEDTGNVVEEIVLDIPEEQIKTNSKKTKGKTTNRAKKYSDSCVEEALSELKTGKPFGEISEAYGIPRTSLYTKARSSGILNATNKLYSEENLRAAIEAVKSGSSLQKASVTTGVPKTVIWRKMKLYKDHSGMRTLHNYSDQEKEAAVKALEKGDDLHSVWKRHPSVPKTTLFREKAKLVEKGILPSSCWKKRKDNKSAWRNQVKKAVEACRNGSMTQIVASTTFNVPKSTIWRHMHGNTKFNENEDGAKEEENEQDQHETEDFNMNESDNNCVKFISNDETAFSPTSLIILSTSGEVIDTSSTSYVISCGETSTPLIVDDIGVAVEVVEQQMDEETHNNKNIT